MTTSVPPGSGATTARLQRRAQAVARLRHPNLVRLLPLPGGAGLSPVLGEARRLADFTLPAGTFKRFDLEQIVRLLLDVLSGLAALHEVVTDGQAFVHGQVSPQNIYIYIDEHGTARLVPLLNAHSMPSAKLEEPGYAAPERIAGDAFDARADVFSVGVMLWEALAGKRLFPDPSPEALLARARAAKPPSLRLAPHLRWATPLCAIAERAIATDPAARFASALDLSNAMAAAAAQQLSKVDTDAWQDEAPTPVLQPRLHLATLRASTPPPAVITLGAPTPTAFAESAPPAVADEAVPLEPETSGRRGRGAVWGLAALALGAAGLLLAPQSARYWRNVAAAVQLAPAVESPPAAAPAAAAAGVAPSAPVPVVAPPAPVPAALPSTSATAAPAPTKTAAPASARPTRGRPPAPLATPGSPSAPSAMKPQSRPREHGDDYGI